MGRRGGREEGGQNQRARKGRKVRRIWRGEEQEDGKNRSVGRKGGGEKKEDDEREERKDRKCIFCHLNGKLLAFCMHWGVGLVCRQGPLEMEVCQDK